MFGWLTKNIKSEAPKKVSLSDAKTYHIAQGNVKLDSKKIEALAFALDEGYSDQSIVAISDGVIQEIQRAKGQLGKVV
jgi:hypothetical protein